MSSIGGGGGNSRIPSGGELGQVTAGQEAAEGGVNFGNAQVGANGSVTVNGVPVDISTAEGAAALIGAVGAEELSQIKSMLHLKEVQGADGPILVPNDSFDKIDTRALRKTLGPSDIGEGADDLEKELGAWFGAQTGTNPFNIHTTPNVERNLQTNPDSGLGTAVGALKAYSENPTQQNLNNATGALGNLARFPGSGTINIHEILFIAFKESIKETNEDKKYFLQKLQMYNDMGEKLSDELRDLTQHSRELGIQTAACKSEDSHKVLTPRPVEVKSYDINSLGTDGELQSTTIKSEKIDRNGLSNTIKELESVQESVRNRRQMASTAFQNFDQKANQLYNLLSSVMKAMSEMRMGTIRNML